MADPISRTFILQSTEAKAHAIDFIRGLDLSQRYEVIVRLHKSKRSDAQNARYWAVLSLIASDTGHTAQEVHEYCKREFLGFEVVSILGKEYEQVRSTTKLNTKQFVDYCEQVEAWAVTELGMMV